VDTSNPDSNQV